MPSLAQADAESGAGRRAIGRRRWDGPSGDEISVASAPLQREREADPLRERRQQPVRQPEVTIGLEQHERYAQRGRRQPDRTSDIAPGPNHGGRVQTGEQPPRGANRAGVHNRRPGRASRGTPRQ